VFSFRHATHTGDGSTAADDYISAAEQRLDIVKSISAERRPQLSGQAR
jgi:hypothetical protein